MTILTGDFLARGLSERNEHQNHALIRGSGR
jgi:hypothetical protein